MSFINEGSGFIFSILIPSWNNLPYLKNCIESIRKHSTYRHEIIVHVNEGKDGSTEWLKKQPDIKLSFSESNIGVCYALNRCRSLATTNYMVYMNDDMYVCPGWDNYLLNEINSIGHNYFFLSSTAIEPKAQSKCSIERNYGATIDSFNEDLLLQEYIQLPMNDWSGATWPPNIVHKDIWDLVGGYSIEFSPGMYSDPDFSMKLWKAGVRLFKGIGRSRVYHFCSISTRRIKHNKGYYRFIAKWGFTSSLLTNHMLRRGEVFTGPLNETGIPTGLRFKNFFNRLSAIIKRTYK